MADIVVKTNNGSETYTGIESVTFNTTQEGVKATFIAQKQADWLQNDETAVDYIKNKPFYENEDTVVKLDNKYLNILEQENVNENVILAEQTFEGFAYNESVGIYLKSGYSLFALQEGETYRVLWDGKQHTCVAYSHLYNGYDAVCLGNEGFAKGESTDLIEPFVIYHVLASGYNGLGAMDSETSHTVAIYQAAAATYKINKTYLPEDIGKQADWNQTDDTAVDFIKNKPENLATEIYVQEQIANIEIPSSQIQSDWEQTDSKALDFIKNKPFGEMSDIIPEQELTFVLTDDAPAIRTSSIAVGQPIVIGETYKVTWDDTTYELVAKDTKDISTSIPGLTPESSPYLGNSNISGLGFGMTDWGEDTGEPFLIGFSASNNNTVTINTTDLVNTTHMVSIIPVNKMKKLSAEWLPDGLATEDFVKEQIAAIEIPEGGGGSVSTEKVIYAEDTWDTFYSDSYFTYIFVQDFNESVPAFPLTLGDECVVVWDGVEYEVTVGDSSNILADTLFVGNGTQFGLLGNGEPFAIAWDSMGVTFVAWTDTEPTEHTVRIYQKAPLTVSWENVTDKPFGEEIVTIFEGTFQDTLVDRDGDGVKDAWSNEMLIEDTSDTTIVIGQTYKIIFNGSEYELECFAFQGIPFIGNEGMITEELNEVPFLLGRDAANVMGTGQVWALILAEPPADLTVSGAYNVKITGGELKKLDNKYLDILEGEEVPYVEILEEQIVEFSPDTPDDENSEYDAVIPVGIAIEAGKTYRVVWDGVEYEFTPSNGYLGNIDLADPFCIVGEGDYTYIITSDQSTSHKIRIYQPAIDTIAIKEKFIPILENGGEELIPETMMELTYQSVGDGSVWGGSIQTMTEAAYNALYSKVGEQVSVMFDGVEYPCNILLEDESFLFLGNFGIYPMAAAEDTGEPFLLVIQRTGEEGSYEYVWNVATNDPAPSDPSATIEHTVSVILNPGYKIKDE